MTKYYCDMCGKEMSMMDKIAKVEISPLGAVTHMGRYFDVCKECADELIAKMSKSKEAKKHE